MGKTIKLTEEQIRRFFGEGFGKRLLGERTQGKEPTPAFSDDTDIPKRYQKTLGHNFDSNKVDAKDRTIVTNTDPDKDGLFFTNQDYIPREVAGGTDLPGFGGAAAKMADFGQANLTKDNAIAGNSDSEALLVKIREVFDRTVKDVGGGSTMNILDVLKILHQIKGKAKSKNGNSESNGDEITEDDAIQFLNSLSIDYILSNFITVNAPDYVFWRLKNLSKDEIAAIETTYGRDFSNFGKRCDGCGATTWKTTVTPYEHDDAHINFEYMGGDAAGKKLNEANDDVDDGIVQGSSFNGAGRVYEKLLPFQIHHMNENPGDNSPLNLSCLCPNCHAITGSYGKQKSNLDSKAFDILKNNTTVNDGSLNGFLNDEEVNRIANEIKKGKFETRTVVNNITGVDNDSANINEFTFDPQNQELQARVQSFGIKNPEQFINDFNELFISIYNEGAAKFKESLKLNEEAGAEDKSEKHGKEEDKKLGGVDFYHEISVSSNKTITLQLYCGKKPYIFSAFKNNAIPLTRMYYETDDNRTAAIIYVRNRIFNAALNAAKEYYHRMSDWISNAPGWAKKSSNDENGNITIDALSKMKSGTYAGQKKRAGLFEPAGSDTNAAITREKKLKSQARSTDLYTQSMLYAMGIILTGDEKRAASTVNNQSKILGDSLIKYLLSQRQKWAGKSLGRTEAQQRETIRQILKDGGFY